MKNLWRNMLVIALVTALSIPAMAERAKRGGQGPGLMNQGPGMREQCPEGPQEGPGGRPPPGQSGRFIEQMLQPKMAEALNLNEAQVTALKLGLEKNRAQESALMEKLQAAGKAQAKIMTAEGEIDEAALMKAIEATGRIRTQMAKLRVQPILLVKKTLTEEQLAAAKKMMHKRMEKRREQWSDDRRGGKKDGQNRGRRWKPQEEDGAPVQPEE